MSALTISGLVKRTGQIRKELTEALPQEKKEFYKQFILQTIQQVEEICNKHHLHPSNLPRLSYNAYQYLCSINLDNLPVKNGKLQQEKVNHRVKGLISYCNYLHHWFLEIAQNASSDLGSNMDMTAIQCMSEEINEFFATREKNIKDQKNINSALSSPSLLALKWLQYLKKDNHLEKHAKVIAYLYQQLLKNNPSLQKDKKITIRLFNTSSLYRIQSNSKQIDIVIHEGFAEAPETLLSIFASAINGSINSERKIKLRDFSSTAEFRHIQNQLNHNGQKKLAGPIGQFYDLTKIFQKVNATYFDSKLQPPTITWSNFHWKRTFGQYHLSDDILTINLSLDQNKIPIYVVEFVMYHELLHKKMGVKQVNHRRQIHPPTFKDQEKKFKDYQKAINFLKSFAKK